MVKTLAEPAEGPVEHAECREKGLVKALGLIDAVLVKGVCLKDTEVEDKVKEKKPEWEEEAEKQIIEEKLTFCFNNNMFLSWWLIRLLALCFIWV